MVTVGRCMPTAAWETTTRDIYFPSQEKFGFFPNGHQGFAAPTFSASVRPSGQEPHYTANANLNLTVGGMAQICFKSLRTHTQGCQGGPKTRNFVRNSKILIARSTIHPKLSKIKNHYWNTWKSSINYFWILNFFLPFFNVFWCIFNDF